MTSETRSQADVSFRCVCLLAAAYVRVCFSNGVAVLSHAHFSGPCDCCRAVGGIGE